MSDHARKHQWIRGPIRDATGTQVIQAYSQKIKKQPGHWLLMIYRDVDGYRRRVVIEKRQHCLTRRNVGL